MKALSGMKRRKESQLSALYLCYYKMNNKAREQTYWLEKAVYRALDSFDLVAEIKSNIPSISF